MAYQFTNLSEFGTTLQSATVLAAALPAGAYRNVPDTTELPLVAYAVPAAPAVVLPQQYVLPMLLAQEKR